MNSSTNEQRIISMASQFIGDSQFQVVVRFHGRRNKIMVDVTEITCHRTSKARAFRVARQHAEKVGIASADSSIISDVQSERKATRLDDTPVAVQIRRICLAFAGVSR